VSDDPPIVIELNPRERRLYDRLRARVIAPRPGSRSGLRDLLLLLPDLAVLLGRLLREPRVPWGYKVLAALGLGYLLSPIDLIPDVILPIGYVDDLLVLGLVLSRMVNAVHPDVVRAHWSGQGDALEGVKRVTAWAESQLSGRVRRLTRGWLG
jgi:uncharacterized membrane protein YkvA (DUF1232 family)